MSLFGQSKMDEKETYLGENIDLQKKKTSREYIVVVLPANFTALCKPRFGTTGSLGAIVYV